MQDLNSAFFITFALNSPHVQAVLASMRSMLSLLRKRNVYNIISSSFTTRRDSGRREREREGKSELRYAYAPASGLEPAWQWCARCEALRLVTNSCVAETLCKFSA